MSIETLENFATKHLENKIAKVRARICEFAFITLDNI